MPASLMWRKKTWQPSITTWKRLKEWGSFLRLVCCSILTLSVPASSPAPTEKLDTANNNSSASTCFVIGRKPNWSARSCHISFSMSNQIFFLRFMTTIDIQLAADFILLFINETGGEIRKKYLYNTITTLIDIFPFVHFLIPTSDQKNYFFNIPLRFFNKYRNDQKLSVQSRKTTSIRFRHIFCFINAFHRSSLEKTRTQSLFLQRFSNLWRMHSLC